MNAARAARNSPVRQCGAVSPTTAQKADNIARPFSSLQSRGAMYSRGLDKSPSRAACDQACDEASTVLRDPWRSPDKRASAGSA
jgi:hypothetical protein